MRRFGKLLVTFFALAFLLAGTSLLQAKEKGTALKQLESAAGKKIEDVKVPPASKPQPVRSTTKRTSSSQSKKTYKSQNLKRK